MTLHNRDLSQIYTDLLIQHAEEDDRICIVEADLMRAVKTTQFGQRFPDRTINVGVAEANMISVAAGISVMGRIPFTHSFTAFASRRACDQVTLSVAYAGTNVKMVGSDPGMTAMLNGGTHMSMEDMAIMRNIPDMVVFEPVDGVQLANLFPKIIAHEGPVYIRLLRRGFPSIFQEGREFEIGKAAPLKEGRDVTIFASGIMVHEALKAEAILGAEGISASVINIHTIKPLDEKTVLEEAMRTKAVVTAENHSVVNGLGSAISDYLSENYPVAVKKIGVRDHFGEVGMQAFLAEKYGLLAADIVKAAKEAMALKEGGSK